MAANLLTLNSSKTEFLFAGLKKQVGKIRYTWNTTHSTLYPLYSTSASSLTNTSPFQMRSYLTTTISLNSCYYRIRQLRCIHLYLDSIPKHLYTVVHTSRATYLSFLVLKFTSRVSFQRLCFINIRFVILASGGKWLCFLCCIVDLLTIWQMSCRVK